MTPVAYDSRGAATRVLELLQVNDLEVLRERSKMLSVRESADLLIPVIVALASEDDGDADPDLQPAVGVALYQCLVRERLAGPSMDSVIAQVTSGKWKKPREIDQSIPRALEAIITRATRERPDERFPSLSHLGAALLPFASKDVREMYEDDFPKQAANVKHESLKLLAAALAAALPLLLATRQSADKPAPTPEPSAEQAAPTPASEPAAALEPEPAQAAPTATARVQDEPAPKADAEQPAPDRAVASASPDTPAAVAAVPSKYPVDVTVEPSTAWIMLDNKPAGRGRLRRELPRDGKPHALHVGAPGYRVKALHFTDEPPPSSVVLAKRGALSAR